LADPDEGGRGRPLVSTLDGGEARMCLGAHEGQGADPLIEADKKIGTASFPRNCLNDSAIPFLLLLEGTL